MEIGRLHLIWDETRRLGEDLEPVLAAGVPTFQLRLKRGTDRERFEAGRLAAEICARTATRLVVNDRCDLALAVGADGVHVGEDDLPVAVVRNLMGPEAMVGATVRNPDAALAAAADGASYLGAGPVYPSRTKPDLPPPIGPEGIARIARAVEIPVIAIGGVTPRRVPELLAAGAYGVAVVGSVWSDRRPRAVVEELLTVLGVGV
ncbi:MAG: thiamine-phosphate synthase [Acidimicrobiia bacterium]|nr:MAG: thiamine-phosphate synthase [Acidimicrobiia bacterium]